MGSYRGGSKGYEWAAFEDTFARYVADGLLWAANVAAQNVQVRRFSPRQAWNVALSRMKQGVTRSAPEKAPGLLTVDEVTSYSWGRPALDLLRGQSRRAPGAAVWFGKKLLFDGEEIERTTQKHTNTLTRSHASAIVPCVESTGGETMAKHKQEQLSPCGRSWRGSTANYVPIRRRFVRTVARGSTDIGEYYVLNLNRIENSHVVPRSDRAGTRLFAEMGGGARVKKELKRGRRNEGWVAPLSRAVPSTPISRQGKAVLRRVPGSFLVKDALTGPRFGLRRACGGTRVPPRERARLKVGPRSYDA